MTSKEIERRVEGILMSVGVENELSYNVTKEDDGTYKRETVGSVPRLDHAKGELLALIQQARVDLLEEVNEDIAATDNYFEHDDSVILHLKSKYSKCLDELKGETK